MIAFAALPLGAQTTSNIIFKEGVTQENFSRFSRVVAQAIYPTPIEPARASGLLSFDIGAGVTAVPVDTEESWWADVVAEDFSLSDHVVVPRLIVSKGLSFATISATYAKVQESDASFIGGALDVPILRGNVALPEIAVRAAYSQLGGLDDYELKTYGAEVFISKGFGPLTPYAAAGRVRSDAEGVIPTRGPAVVTLADESEVNRFTVGVRLSLLVPKIVVEATQAEELTYAAKVSFGF